MSRSLPSSEHARKPPNKKPASDLEAFPQPKFIHRDHLAKRKSGMPALQRFTEPEFQPYVAAIGQASLAWNDLHEMLAALFELVILGGWKNVANSVWHSSNQDRASRAMLKSVLHTIGIRWPRGFPKAEDDIKWLLDRVESLEDQRNDIVHSPLWLMRAPSLAKSLGIRSRVLPSVFSGHRRAAKLAEKDLLTEFRWVRDTALCLRDYAGDIMATLEGQLSTWPERPKLPNRGRKKRPIP